MASASVYVPVAHGDSPFGELAVSANSMEGAPVGVAVTKTRKRRLLEYPPGYEALIRLTVLGFVGEGADRPVKLDDLIVRVPFPWARPRTRPVQPLETTTLPPQALFLHRQLHAQRPPGTHQPTYSPRTQHKPQSSSHELSSTCPNSILPWR